MKTITWILPALLILPAFGQMQENSPKMTCEDGHGRNRDSERHCEIKETTIPAVSRITVDGGQNGGVSVRGWNQNQILIRAKVQTNAPTLDEARALVSQINLQSAGGNIRHDAPRLTSPRGYAVSYEVLVPHNTSVKAEAHNGGINLSDVQGDIEFSAQNGGVNLARLAGNVRGSTMNGGLNIELMGDRWEGTQLDAKTTNGGVKVSVPQNYSARTETSTVNGGIKVDIPITVTGKIGRELNTTLGNGGNLIRLTTTNGGVTLARR